MPALACVSFMTLQAKKLKKEDTLKLDD